MTESTTPEPDGEPTGTAEIKADIERTRAELADTVDKLGDKLNPKVRAGNTAESLKATASEKAAQAKAAAPEPVQRALDTAGEKVAPVAHKVNEQTQPHRGKIIAGVAAAVVLVVIVRRRRG